jgi:hypothetical protein
LAEFGRIEVLEYCVVVCFLERDFTGWSVEFRRSSLESTNQNSLHQHIQKHQTIKTD